MMNAAEQVRGQAAAATYAAEIERELSEAYRQGRRAGEAGHPVPHGMEADAYHGDPEADAWLTGWADAMTGH